MTNRAMPHHTVLILGDHDSQFPPHGATRDALRHATPNRRVVNTRWLGADDLQLYPGLVAEAAAIVLAPPGPRSLRVLPAPILEALTLIRERDIPFLATGEAHGLVFISVARDILGLAGAGSTRYGDDVQDPVVHALYHRREASALGTPHTIELEVRDDPLIAPLYGGPGRVNEITDTIHGLSPDYAQAIIDAGLRPAMIDPHGGRPYLHTMEGQKFHVTAAFLPQLKSRLGAPHPLFRGLLRAALDAA